MAWWRFAQQEPWTWTWRPVIGVWAVVALLGWAYRALVTSLRKEDPDWRTDAWRPPLWATALFLVWVSLDWPAGPLGAGGLSSAREGTYLVVGIVVPALLLLAVPPRAFQPLTRRARILSTLRGITHPLSSFVIFNATMTVTQWPGVVDSLLPTQAGSFLLDLSWLCAGLIFWWPLIAPVPEHPRFSPLAEIGYLALNALLVRPPFAMMMFSEDPIYRVFERATPPPLDAMDDQMLAAGILQVGTAWLMFVAVAMVFWQWSRAEEDR